MARKLTHEEVKYYIEIESNSGCKLLSSSYEGTRKDINIQCSCGNVFQTRFNTFKHNNKRICDICSKDSFVTKVKNNNRTNWNYDLVKDLIESIDGYRLVSKEYKTALDKLEINCSNNHTFSMTLNDIKNGHRCPQCRMLEIKEKLRYSFDFVQDYIKENREGYTLLTKKDEYIDGTTKLKIKCDIGHIFHMSFRSIKQNDYYCSKCGIEARSGKKHWNWKGGISPLRSLLMSRAIYKKWRLSVLKRDDYKCQICSLGHDLEVHHLESFSRNKELRYNIDNGITLCKYCHNPQYKGSFHNIYGNINFNTKKFNEYLERRVNGEFNDRIKEVI